MRGHEQLSGGSESQRGFEAHSLPIQSPEVQAVLMLTAYQAAHSEQRVNLEDWEQNDASVQSAAMIEWVGDLEDKNSCAALFRAYVDDHPTDRINTHEECELTKLLAVVKGRRSKLH